MQKKNNWTRDKSDYFSWHQSEIRLDRKDPGPGYRHVLTVAHVRTFVGLLPGWDDIAIGLDAIVLDRGRADAMGWYGEGVVGLCAWPAHSGYWHEADHEWIEDNADMLGLLGVAVDGLTGVSVSFGPNSKRARSCCWMSFLTSLAITAI